MIAREEYPGGRVFEVVVGDLLAEPTDAIVNAANGHLAHGGGVAAAIARAAGPALEEEGDRIVAERGPLEVGEAVVTTAGTAAVQGRDPRGRARTRASGQEEDHLVQALGAAFRRAHERGWASLSFPAVEQRDLRRAARGLRARLRARGARASSPPTRTRACARVRLCLFGGPLVDARAGRSSAGGSRDAHARP